MTDIDAVALSPEWDEWDEMTEGEKRRLVQRLGTARITGDDLRAAIEKACSLINPRLSEVEWNEVAAALRAHAARADRDGLQEAAEGLLAALDWWTEGGSVEWTARSKMGRATRALRAALTAEAEPR